MAMTAGATTGVSVFDRDATLAQLVTTARGKMEMS
jgi:hypothetical protein